MSCHRPRTRILKKNINERTEYTYLGRLFFGGEEVRRFIIFEFTFKFISEKEKKTTLSNCDSTKGPKKVSGFLIQKCEAPNLLLDSGTMQKIVSKAFFPHFTVLPS